MFSRRIVRRVFDAEGDKNGNIRERFPYIVVVGVRHGKRQNILRFKWETRVFCKGFFDLSDSAGKIVRMVYIDVQNDGNRRIKAKKRVLIFACLKNKVIAAADGIRPAISLVSAPESTVGRLPAARNHMRHHRGGGRFAVHTGNSDAMRIILHDIAEQVRTIDGGDSPRRSRGKLRIFHRDSARIHNCVTAVDVIRTVLVNDRNPCSLEPFGHRGTHPVRAPDVIAPLEADKSKARPC